MSASPVATNSCPSQCSSLTPDKTWSIEDLGDYAQGQDRAITDGERSLTLNYWNLGLALNLARAQFDYGQWSKFLAELKIDPTRASKARAIHRSFPSAEQVSNLSVKEAYECRTRKNHRGTGSKQRKASATPADDAETDLVQFFVQVCRSAEMRRHEAESTSPKKAALYLTAADEALCELAKLRAVLGRKAASQ